MNEIIYKVAETSDEYEQIYRLNYETFVEEIPQHQPNENRRLVDKFDRENSYMIAKRGEDVIGMIAVRGNRPFSLDQKLEDLDQYFPGAQKLCEIRLLSVKKPYRGTRVFFGLTEQLVNYCFKHGYTMALISGTTRQLKLYRHIGFKPFGPLVGAEGARFQPMYLTKESFETSAKVFRRLLQKELDIETVSYSFLPGPVRIRQEVKVAWGKEPISHRSTLFKQKMEKIRHQLCQLTNANYAEVAVGTGTLANDMVAAQLSALPSEGLILANGEFGERLIKHGMRWGLSFQTIRKEWGTPIPIEEVEDMLANHPQIKWLWTVHCETSTGYVTPLERLKEVSQKHSVMLCLDAASSVGVIPTDLSGVFLATTSSGKGLASYPGLCIVFHETEIFPNKQLPSYLDIGQYYVSTSIPYTHSFGGVLALEAALEKVCYTDVALSEAIRHTLQSAGMEVAWEEGYSPGVITIPLPKQINSKAFGDLLKSRGILVSYESGYLLKRNWIQFTLMGDQDTEAANRAAHISAHLFQRESRAWSGSKWVEGIGTL